MIEFVSLGYCSNDHLCRLPMIPIDHKVEMLEHQIQGGGPAADAAVAAARLGLKTMFLTSVGSDQDGEKIIADLRNEKIDVSHIMVRPGCGSPIAYCWIDPQGKRSVAWTRSNLKLLSADDVPADVIAHARLLHLDGHHPEAAVCAGRIAKDHHVPVSFDAGTPRDGVGELVEIADLLIASEYFARTFTGKNDLKEALFELAKYNNTVTCITRGEQGCLLYDETNSLVELPCFNQLPVVDTTGAGDAFHAGFAVAYLDGLPFVECARYGSAVAGLKCGKLGARAGLPGRKEVEDFLKKQESRRS